jgi:hypothetical protein
MYEWVYNYVGGHRLFTIYTLVSIVGTIFAVVMQIIYCGCYQNWFAVAQLFWLPFFGLVLFLANWNRIVPGAKDILTGSLAAMAVAKDRVVKSNTPITVQTSVGFISMGL